MSSLVVRMSQRCRKWSAPGSSAMQLERTLKKATRRWWTTRQCTFTPPALSSTDSQTGELHTQNPMFTISWCGSFKGCWLRAHPHYYLWLASLLRRMGNSASATVVRRQCFLKCIIYECICSNGRLCKNTLPLLRRGKGHGVVMVLQNKASQVR